MDPPLRDILTRRETAFHRGSVAPDLFYYDLPVPLFGERSLVPWGEIIHGRDGEDTMAHIVPLLDRVRALHDSDTTAAETLLAFVSGYLTHVAADTIFHPYIYAITGNYYAPEERERKLAEARHRLFETCLDLHILELRGETLGHFGLRRKIALAPPEKALLLDAYADALQSTHRPAIAPGHVRRITHRAYGRAILFLSLFQSVPLVKSLILLNRISAGRLGKMVHLGYGPHRALDFLDFAGLPDVPHPVTGEPLEGSIQSMIEKSCLRGIGYLQAALEYSAGRIDATALRRVLRPLSLNTGLEKVPTNRMQYSRISPALPVQ